MATLPAHSNPDYLNTFEMTAGIVRNVSVFLVYLSQQMMVSCICVTLIISVIYLSLAGSFAL
jgi:hypothetical protein